MGLRIAAAVVPIAFAIALTTTAAAQEPSGRAAAIERAQAEKAAIARPYVPSKAEKYFDQAEAWLSQGLTLHPYFQSAYSGGGFTLGAGYMRHVSPYNTVDVRGSFTLKGYKRVEAEFVAPRFVSRWARLSVLGGWREATQVGFYGLGTATSADDRVNYGFNQVYGHGLVEVRPRDSFVVLRGGVEASQWEQVPGTGSHPSIETAYSPSSLTGLESTITYIHSQGMAAIDTRPAPGYARRGGFYGITFRDFTDIDGDFGFKQIDYDAIQHIPVLRESWVLALHAGVSTTGTKTGQQIPFFMLPSVGGGSSLRGYNSWRFRDRNSLLLQAEWRVVVNRFLDTALFYDAGKVTAHTRDLDLNDLKDDYGLGFRFHSPLATPLRVDFAKSREGLAIVFSSSASF
jgi:hypothetical protein